MVFKKVEEASNHAAEQVFGTNHSSGRARGRAATQMTREHVVDSEHAYTEGIIYVCIGFLIRPNTKLSVFRVTGLKILGSVGTHIFVFNNFFPEKISFYQLPFILKLHSL